jgi:hypothetical protein
MATQPREFLNVAQKPTPGPEQFPDCSLTQVYCSARFAQNCEHVD